MADSPHIDVAEVARLARLALDPADEARFGKDLAGIVVFVQKLTEVDTTNIESATIGTMSAKALRDDEARELPEAVVAERLLDAAPAAKKRHVVVQAVFEHRT